MKIIILYVFDFSKENRLSSFDSFGVLFLVEVGIFPMVWIVLFIY